MRCALAHAPPCAHGDRARGEAGLAQAPLEAPVAERRPHPEHPAGPERGAQRPQAAQIVEARVAGDGERLRSVVDVEQDRVVPTLPEQRGDVGNVQGDARILQRAASERRERASVPLDHRREELGHVDRRVRGQEVEDGARVLEAGRPGEVYNVGGNSEKTNLEVVNTLCAVLDELVPDSPHRPHANLIEFVADRPGHDQRYAIDATKLEQELGWTPQETFATGLRRTANWYLDNREWVQRVMDGSYRGERLGATV